MTKSTNKNIKETQVNSLGFLFWLKWVLSCVWPIRITSKHTPLGFVEVVLFRGKRLLNSENANYSNGNLQDAFRNLFVEVDLDLPKCSSALILGYGFGGVAKLIKKYNPSTQIIGVEFNEVVVQWYYTFCNAFDDVELICADAEQYLQNESTKFDLIICDLYDDLNVPDKFQRNAFLKMMANHLNSNGVLVYNKVVQSSLHKQEFNDLMLRISALFKNITVNEQFGLNKFIIAQNKTI